VRAGIVEKPEDYRWNSIGCHVQTNNKDNFLSLDFGLKEFNVLDADERLRLYRKFLYEKGSNTAKKDSQISEKTVEKERRKNFKINPIDRFKYRTRYFSDSGIIGTKEFVAQNYVSALINPILSGSPNYEDIRRACKLIFIQILGQECLIIILGHGIG